MESVLGLSISDSYILERRNRMASVRLSTSEMAPQSTSKTTADLPLHP